MESEREGIRRRGNCGFIFVLELDWNGDLVDWELREEEKREDQTPSLLQQKQNLNLTELLSRSLSLSCLEEREIETKRRTSILHYGPG